MTNDLTVLDYREYYSSIRNHRIEKKAYLTKENCETIEQPAGFLEHPECLLVDKGYEEPLYLRENIEIIFKEEYLCDFPELGIEKRIILKNKLVLPNEPPARYLMISGKLFKVFTLEQIREANSINIYCERSLPDFLWKEYQVERRFPDLKLEPSGYYFEGIRHDLQPLFDVSEILKGTSLLIFTDKELYQIRSFVIGMRHAFDSFPQSWKVDVETEHMEELGFYRGTPVVKLLPSAFTNSPFSRKLHKDEIEEDDMICTLWDIETVRDVLNANDRKITALIPKGITEEGLAVFSSKQLGWLKDRFHVFWAINKI